MKPILISFLALLCVLFLSLPKARARRSEKAFKGIELYSWKDSSGNWMFALLPGTNRLKTAAEVKEKGNQIPGAKELAKHFLGLAEGEEVFWFHRDLKGFVYPNREMMDSIAISAKTAKIKLHVPPKENKNG